jgi:hypothetical protein
VVQRRRKCDDGDHEYDLRAEAKRDTVDFLVGVRPAMKPLVNLKWAVWPASMQKLQWIGQHRSNGTEQYRPEAVSKNASEPMVSASSRSALSNTTGAPILGSTDRDLIG